MSHKFKIEIELENKDYCNGCPCLRMRRFSGVCPKFGYVSNSNQSDNMPKQHYKYYRPDICKQNDKEK